MYWLGSNGFFDGHRSGRFLDLLFCFLAGFGRDWDTLCDLVGIFMTAMGYALTI